MPKEDTQFKPGVSGNPLGRPKKPREVAARILLQSGDGKAMVDFHMARMKDESEKYEHRSASCDWLMLWGVGKPDPTPLDEEEGGRVLPFNIQSLSPPEEETDE